MVGAVYENGHGVRFEVVAVESGVVTLDDGHGCEVGVTLLSFAAHFSRVRGQGRPALTPGQKPARVEVLLPRDVAAAIDATGRKRSEYIRAAVVAALACEAT